MNGKREMIKGEKVTDRKKGKEALNTRIVSLPCEGEESAVGLSQNYRLEGKLSHAAGKARLALREKFKIQGRFKNLMPKEVTGGDCAL